VDGELDDLIAAPYHATVLSPQAMERSRWDWSVYATAWVG
jgi:hypothetical protein